jgi:transketolase C-terminal domain/subunit
MEFVGLDDRTPRAATRRRCFEKYGLTSREIVAAVRRVSSRKGAQVTGATR